jgi:beta-lactamase class A
MFPIKKKKEVDVVPVKPVRKRKPKVEPPKPWGNKERLIVFIFLVLAPISSILFLVHSKTSDAPKVLGEMSRPPIEISVLKENLINETKNLKGIYGIWVQALDNSYSFGINEKHQFDGASLLKLPLMIGYYKGVDKGEIDPATTYTLRYSDKASGAGILSDMPAGTIINYHDMVEAMGKNSDNTAFQIMINTLGVNVETNTIQDLGMKNTNFNNGLTTPFDMGILFYKVVNTNLLSNNSKNEFLNFLTDTDYEDLIPAATPDNVRVVHKFGADDGELNDAGIIYTNKPFILIIMAKDIDLGEAKMEIPKISKIVYNYLK